MLQLLRKEVFIFKEVYSFAIKISRGFSSNVSFVVETVGRRVNDAFPEVWL